MPEPTDKQVALAAFELASQEFYNPAWCHPGKTTTADDRELYRRRARLILEAALLEREEPSNGCDQKVTCLGCGGHGREARTGAMCQHCYGSGMAEEVK